MADIKVTEDAHALIVAHCKAKGVTVKEWASTLLTGAVKVGKVQRGKRLERLSNVCHFQIGSKPPFWGKA